ncbi:DNA gyrase subunit B [Streptomyces sp. NPDC006446]|uniref:DNA gyrase subunit B n=1 Tax=Streptomyces sp. NPDC006446 TaxID=3154301 RepID=UPI0033B35360
MNEEAIPYDASHIKVLEGLEAIRKRPGMYVGSTGVRGLHQIVFEVAGRAVNEVLAGRAGAVDIALTSDGGVRVADDGPGIPVEADVDAEADSAGLEALLTRPHAWRDLGGRHNAAMSAFGMGPCVTNALSSRLTVEVRREGVRWVQEYTRGVSPTPPTDTGPATGSGTTIVFWPDPEIFETTECSFDVLARRFKELAYLHGGLDISFHDERPPGGTRSERFRYPGGARDLVASLEERAGAPVHPDVIAFEREDPRMEGTVEVALRWSGSRQECVRGFANSLPTPEGGTHVEGFRQGTAAAVNAYLREMGQREAADPDLGADRIGEGLTAVVSVKLDRPEFQGATRGRLGGDTVRSCVADAVREHLGTWLRGHPDQGAAVISRLCQGSRRD